MKEKLQHFMMGRYGIDSFSKFLLGVTVFFCAIAFTISVASTGHAITVFPVDMALFLF